MPIITVEASKRLSKENKRKLIEDSSQIVADAYGLPVQSITMIIYENCPENIGVSGKPVSNS